MKKFKDLKKDDIFYGSFITSPLDTPQTQYEILPIKVNYLEKLEGGFAKGIVIHGVQINLNKKNHKFNLFVYNHEIGKSITSNYLSTDYKLLEKKLKNENF